MKTFSQAMRDYIAAGHSAPAAMRATWRDVHAGKVARPPRRARRGGIRSPRKARAPGGRKVRHRNPLAPGYSRRTISRNIERERRTGVPEKRAAAMSYRSARSSYRRRHPRGPMPARLRRNALKLNPGKTRRETVWLVVGKRRATGKGGFLSDRMTLVSEMSEAIKYPGAKRARRAAASLRRQYPAFQFHAKPMHLFYT